jgi:hypothetical protein
MEPIVGKPGYLTTEFWVTILTLLSSLLIAWRGDDFGLAANSQGLAILAVNVLSVGYALARSVLKVGTHKAIADQNAAAAYSKIQLRSDDPVV